MSQHPGPTHRTDAAEHGTSPWMPAAIALVFLLALAMLMAHLGRFPLMAPDEVRNAEVGREMFVSGDWLVPTYNGLPYLDKPCFFFKCVAISFEAFGVHEGAARLPSALSGLLLLVAMYLFARRMYGGRVAVMAVAIVATMPFFVVFSRLVIMDMMFTLFVSLAIFAGFLGEEHEGRRRMLWHLAGAAAAALATLVKGPVGFLLYWIVLTVFFVCDRRPRAILRLFSPLNLVVLFGLVLPWFLLLSERHPDFPHYGIVRETFARFTQGEVFRRRKPFYFYGPLIVGACFVWSVLLPGAMAAAWKARGNWMRADRLCVAWACAVVIFFSIPHSKQPGYILSIMVPLGLLVARVFAAAMEGTCAPAVNTVRRGTTALAVLCLALAGGIGSIMLFPADATHWLHCDRADLDAMLPHLKSLVVTSVVFAGLAAFVRQRRSVCLAFLLFAAFFPVLAWAGFGGLEAYAETRSKHSVVGRMPPLPPNTQLVSLQGFSLYLPFYMQRTLTLVTEKGKELPSNYIPYYLSITEPWPPNVVHLRDQDGWLAAQARPLYVIGNKYSRATLQRLAEENQVEIRELSHGYFGVLLDRAEEP